MDTILLIIALLMLVAGVAVCLVKTQYAFVAVALMYPIEQLLQSYAPDLIFRAPWAINAVVFGICIFAVTSAFFQKRDPLRGWLNPASVAVFCLYTYILLAMTWTPSIASAQFFLKGSFPYWFMFMLFTPLLCRNIIDFRRVLLPIMLISTLVSIMIFISPRVGFVYGRINIDLGYVVGYGELGSNPLALADMAGAGIIIALLWRGGDSRFIMLGRVVAFVACAALAVASGSRGQVIFAFVCSFLCWPLLSTKRNWGQFLSVGAIGGIIAVMVVVLSTLALGGEGAERWTGASAGDGLLARFNLAISMLEAYVANPFAYVFGLGTSAFNHYYQLRERGGPLHWYPHNVLIEAITEYGFIGFGLLLLTLAYGFASSLKLFRSVEPDRELRSTAAILLAMLIFQLFLSFKQGHLMSPPFLMPMLLIAAKLWKVQQFELEQQAIWGGYAPGDTREFDEEGNPIEQDEPIGELPEGDGSYDPAFQRAYAEGKLSNS